MTERFRRASSLFLLSGWGVVLVELVRGRFTGLAFTHMYLYAFSPTCSPTWFFAGLVLRALFLVL